MTSGIRKFSTKLIAKIRANTQKQRFIATRVPHSLALFLLFIIGSSTAIGVAIMDYRDRQAHVFELAHETLTKVTSRVESTIHEKLSVIPALVALVRASNYSQPDDKNQFERFEPVFSEFSHELNKQIKGLLSIQLAPDAIVTLMTNAADNKAALGHDLLIDDNRREQVLRAIAERSQLTAGPLELIQGGEAIISRKAIFSKAATSSQSRYVSSGRVYPDASWLAQIPADFWGLATVVIDIATIYEEAGLKELNPYYKLAIRGRNGLGAKGEVFWGEAEIFDAPVATQLISVPGGEWQFAIDTDHRTFTSTYIIAILGVVFTFLLVFAYHSQRARAIQVIHSQAKSDFLTKMSHELRTPLNGIIGFSDMMHMRQADLTEKHRRYLAHIRSSSKFLLSLINDLLDLSMIESGKIKLDATHFKLHELLNECVFLLKSEADNNHVSVDILPVRPLAIELHTDQNRLRQIILNLLSNAIKYNRTEGSVTIHYSIQDNDRVSIEIEDTGTGIPEEKLSNLFSMFSRLEIHSQIKGVGVGLVIVKNLVSLLGGEMQIDSRLGKGSRFVISIPKTLVSKLN